MKLKNLNLLTLLFLIFSNINLIKADSITIIHKDPTDIRKTSIRGGANTSLPYGSGMYFGLNQYVNKSTMLYAYWFIFTEYSKSSVIQSTYDSDLSPNFFHIRNFGIERHIVDVEVADVYRVNITSRFARYGLGNNDEFEYVAANKRKVLAFTGGLMVLNGRELYFRNGDFNRQNIYLTNASTDKKVDVTDKTLKTYAEDIYTRTSVTSLEFGLKHKRMHAVGLKPSDRGRRWSESLMEYYFSVLIPVAGRGDEKVYLNGKTSEAYKITNLKTANPGVKLGFNFRSHISTDLEFGAEAGFLPSVINGSTLYLSAHLGICLNFGKLKLINEKL
jgi:hypothetical protein